MPDEPMVSGITVPPQVLAPAPASAAELPKPGEMAAAPVIPAKGPAGQAAGSPVIVVVQKFWDSPTIKGARAMVLVALGGGITVIATQVTMNGGIKGLDWRAVLNVAINAALVSLAGGWMAYKRKHDNNPVE